MNKTKRLKDPVYGYISIPVKYMNNVIDTSIFQRLRRIIQTSYSPLYSSAVHNRFVHSLGVYHLGDISVQKLKQDIINKYKDIVPKLDRINEVFLLACLLHDVGHAPFSHTGEQFYLDINNGYSELHNELVKLVGCDDFLKDVPKEKSSSAAPHEIMSAIVGLREYSSYFKESNEKEFFARCIIGYKFSEINKENSLKNCFISLLNSKVIDVDKLDYLIRDAYITGFDTVNIDYERLLSALTIIEKDEQFEVAYYKSAISVIENVVYAHDSERKWIQNHPTVLYESYILQHVISNLSKKMNSEDKKLFSLKSLSAEGQEFGKNIKIKLMCDDDIIYLMKNIYPDSLSKEYFERKNRRHAIWKSEAEYKAFVLDIIGSGELLDKFESAMENTAKFLTKNTDLWVINDELIEKITNELEELKNHPLEDRKTNDVQKKQKTNILKVMKCLKDYSEEKNLECNFVILRVSQFNSGFSKPDFSDIKIVFKTADSEKIAKFEDIASSLNAKGKERDNFFYLFYKRKNSENSDIDNAEICKRLFKEFILSI
ncbi:HD domain-containing protein [Clostridium felsineum]|uniref:HD domain-containing protein n=1 Tax=Clostridium felsineum TaxID=36839 RepID=UPI00214DC235|nr:HD domain-containing protein [Clostridium felsineum]MCR3758903.1 HD domain-containing protein [Clostridium felsineum]